MNRTGHWRPDWERALEKAMNRMTEPLWKRFLRKLIPALCILAIYWLCVETWLYFNPVTHKVEYIHP